MQGNVRWRIMSRKVVHNVQAHKHRGALSPTYRNVIVLYPRMKAKPMKSKSINGHRLFNK